jgi:coenzyme PQQ biosynthesis protein C
MGDRIRWDGDRTLSDPVTTQELEAALRQVGRLRYHNLHRFHRRLHGGHCSLAEVRAWALNRYYYQAMIPIKDATILSRMHDRELRREWRQRIIDHDGRGPDDGGIERWLKLTDGLGLNRDYVLSARGVLPGVRFAVDAYVQFCQTRPLLEAIASSLTELFSPQIINERISGMLTNYDFVGEETLAYFTARPPQAQRDSNFALSYVLHHAGSGEQQQAVIRALEFKCDVLWAQLDALWLAYVDHELPPGVWNPEEKM